VFFFRARKVVYTHHTYHLLPFALLKMAAAPLSPQPNMLVLIAGLVELLNLANVSNGQAIMQTLANIN
jgi:hypothetical protein